MSWCVAGSPLPSGAGWRIWFALDPGEPPPASVVVRRYEESVGGSVVPTKPQRWQPLPSLPSVPKVFGILNVELVTPEPGGKFSLRVPDSEAAPNDLVWRAMPDKIGPEGLCFIFSSCHWEDDDRTGHLSAAIKEVQRQEGVKPAFKLLIGDQLYLDWPNEKGLDSAEKTTADRYLQYWGNPKYREALLACPNFFVCDDHEFWNDYPEWQTHLMRSWTEDSRREWGDVANSFYEVFQAANNGTDSQGRNQRWMELKFPPVSMFLSDTRSFRSSVAEQPLQFLDDTQFQAMEKWQRELTGPGILVLGQPLFQKDGDFKDHSLSNFPDQYRRLLNLIESSLLGKNGSGVPHDILILSGDIHTGRHVRAWVPLANARGGAEVHELIASPTSCVLAGNLKEREPELPPSTIPPTPPPGRIPWKIDLGSKPSFFGGLMGEKEVPSKDVLFTTIDNNLGVLRLHQSTKRPDGIRVEFSLYIVRRAHKPVSHFLTSQETINFKNKEQFRPYNVSLELS